MVTTETHPLDAIHFPAIEFLEVIDELDDGTQKLLEELSEFFGTSRHVVYMWQMFKSQRTANQKLLEH